MTDSKGVIDLLLKPEALRKLGLPDIAYPIPGFVLAEHIRKDGELPLAWMLRGLQDRAKEIKDDWQQFGRAIHRLVCILAC